MEEAVELSFALGSAVDSAHKRIVWGLHFCPFDPTLLASGSRDGRVKLWRVIDGKVDAEGSGARPTLVEIAS